MDEVDILLVEDNASDAELLCEALKDIGLPHRLQVARDGEEALRVLANRERPQLIILDLNLPKVSGIEVLKILKKDIELRLTPIIILTNSQSQDDVARCYGHFANAYVRKPVGYDELMETLKSTWEFWMKKAVLPLPDSQSSVSTRPSGDRSDK